MRMLGIIHDIDDDMTEPADVLTIPKKYVTVLLTYIKISLEPMGFFACISF